MYKCSFKFTGLNVIKYLVQFLCNLICNLFLMTIICLIFTQNFLVFTEPVTTRQSGHKQSTSYLQLSRSYIPYHQSAQYVHAEHTPYKVSVLSKPHLINLSIATGLRGFSFLNQNVQIRSPW